MVKAVPIFDKKLLEVIDTVDPGMVDSSQQYTPYFLVNRIMAGLFSGHNHSEMKADVAKTLLWARAFSCRNVNVSAAMKRLKARAYWVRHHSNTKR